MTEHRKESGILAALRSVELPNMPGTGRMSETELEQLYQLARRNHPRARAWCGYRGTGSSRHYVCYVCDQTVTKDSASYPPTKTALAATQLHGLAHLEDM